MQKINPGAPAFPITDTVHPDKQDRCLPLETGLSIRAELAARFMAALLGNPQLMNTDGRYTVNDGHILWGGVAKDAFAAADSFIKEGNREG